MSPPSKSEINRFTEEVRRIAKEQEITKTEAVVFYCQQKGLDPASVVKLVNKGLRMQIAAEANKLNLLKKKRRKTGN